MSDSNNTDARILAVEARLNEISSKMVLSTKFMLATSLVLISGMSIYFVVSLDYVSELWEPETLVAQGELLVSQELPKYRLQLQDQLKQAAPTWAENLSQQAIDAAPDARKKLEDQIVDQTKVTIEKYIQIGDNEFKSILQENRKEFEETLQSLASDKEYTDETVSIFEAAINKELGQDMHDQAEQVFGTLVALREKAENLATDGNLTKEERIERDSLRLLRRLQLNEGDVRRARIEAKAAAEKARQQAELKAKQDAELEGKETPAEPDSPAENTEEDAAPEGQESSEN
ncbi:MAG: hypothetical protein VB858_22580 [Planctomycetaceae bacterium]